MTSPVGATGIPGFALGEIAGWPGAADPPFRAGRGLGPAAHTSLQPPNRPPHPTPHSSQEQDCRPATIGWSQFESIRQPNSEHQPMSDLTSGCRRDSRPDFGAGGLGSV